MSGLNHSEIDNVKPTEEAVNEAMQNPGGWGYVLDKKYPKTGRILPEAIVGAWKVNEKGLIEGPFKS
ncbi:hypothetical protein [Parachitinimonas caeni]|uniref:Uncharacterized protein n=1 Tax=Parachitinimonas caeni TaxID=3031301 RepID=A0ABT7E472_9NEIS|nr:hypothetical protein [Parachitinimonas caeni]MDK2127049.1 hypothetical protein [Parachitinimonas caeni]